MTKRVSRRRLLQGVLAGGALGGVLLATRRYPGPIKDAYDITDALNYSIHDLMLPDQPRVREYSPSDVAEVFPTSGTTSPSDESYRLLREKNFADWSLKIDGMVNTPLELSLAKLKAMDSQTQVTLHTCDEGWSAIGQWTGVKLATLLSQCGLKPDAKYVVFNCMDTMRSNNKRYYESIDLFAANHPQTILAYGLNGEPLPEPNGAPLRLRIETQIGYKHAKYIERIELTDSLEKFGSGRGGWWEDSDRAPWYAGL